MTRPAPRSRTSRISPADSGIDEAVEDGNAVCHRRADEGDGRLNVNFLVVHGGRRAGSHGEVVHRRAVASEIIHVHALRAQHGREVARGPGLPVPLIGHVDVVIEHRRAERAERGCDIGREKSS